MDPLVHHGLHWAFGNFQLFWFELRSCWIRRNGVGSVLDCRACVFLLAVDSMTNHCGPEANKARDSRFLFRIFFCHERFSNTAQSWEPLPPLRDSVPPWPRRWRRQLIASPWRLFQFKGAIGSETVRKLSWFRVKPSPLQVQRFVRKIILFASWDCTFVGLCVMLSRLEMQPLLYPCIFLTGCVVRFVVETVALSLLLVRQTKTVKKRLALYYVF